MDYDILWNQDRIPEIVRRDNSIVGSFLALLRDTVISLVLVAVSYWFHHSIDFIGVFFLSITICCWFFSFVFSISMSIFLKKSEKDAIADMLAITNAILGMLILGSSILLWIPSILGMALGELVRYSIGQKLVGYTIGILLILTYATYATHILSKAARFAFDGLESKIESAIKSSAVIAAVASLIITFHVIHYIFTLV